MKIKPNLSYQFAGQTGIGSGSLKAGRVYKAIIATNQPRYKEKGLIFVKDMLLSKEEYTIVS